MMRDVYDWNLMQEQKENIESNFYELPGWTAALLSVSSPHSQINPVLNMQGKFENKNEKR